MFGQRYSLPLLMFTAVATSLVGCGSQAPQTLTGISQSTIQTRHHIPGQVLIKFKATVRTSDIQQFNQSYRLTTLSIIPRIKVHVMKTAAGVDSLMMVQEVQRSPLVEYAEPNYLVTIEKK